MIGGLGVGELSIILCIVVVLFGAGRLAGIGSGLGKGIRNFKKEINPEDQKKKELENKSEESEEKTSD
jgi:sec-independent protein translocase protein TatA